MLHVVIDAVVSAAECDTEGIACMCASAGDDWRPNGLHFRRVAFRLALLRRLGKIEWTERTRDQYGAGTVWWALSR